MICSLGGASLNRNGLHLGHFYGSVLPLSRLPRGEFARHSFIILDRNARLVCTLADYEERLSLIGSQIEIIADYMGREICYVRESVLEGTVQKLAARLSTMTSLAQLISHHPNKKLIRNRNFSILLSDLFFPMLTASMCMALRTTHVLLTGNDYSIVSLTQACSRRLNTKYGLDIPIPTLAREKGDCVLGFNYRKMAEANGNVIFLGDSEASFERKLNKLFDFKHFFEQYPHYRALYLEEKDCFEYPLCFLPMRYRRQFGSQEGCDVDRKFRSGQRQELFHSILEPFAGIRRMLHAQTDASRSRVALSRLREHEAATLRAVTPHVQEIIRSMECS